MVNVELFVSFVIVEKHNIVKSYERPIEFNVRSRIGDGETDTNRSIFLFPKNPESSCQEKPIDHRSYGKDVRAISERNSDS